MCRLKARLGTKERRSNLHASPSVSLEEGGGDYVDCCLKCEISYPETQLTVPRMISK